MVTVRMCSVVVLVTARITVLIVLAMITQTVTS
ncbi:unnamed protein product [Anisakis simplex]|uniref:Uncharacterized protein n=1 Tax=Anisakis simplex TaxID=6269 RepID=A0A0M3KB09_ANISI|nr:unnamed protein product [Anisakis simplex]